MSNIYVDPIIKKYQDLITTAMPDVFKAVYQGDPINVPASRLPALVISKVDTKVSKMTNVEDAHAMTLLLTVITDIRQEINDDTQVVPGVAMLYDLMEGRDDDTYALKLNSVLGVLRRNELVNVARNLRTDLGSFTSVSYGLTIGKRQTDYYATEGQVRFVANFSQVR